MNAAGLLVLYEQVAEAPDAIGRLRRFVLDLAVRGKLVEQNPNDEPASELLKRIAAEKARLIEAGQIRKPRDLANGEEREPPFHVPVTWRWSRLDSVGAIIGGGTPPAGDTENFTEPGDGIPWLTPADLGGYRDLYIERGARDLTEKGLDSSSATMMPAGTVLFTSRAPIGYVAIAANPISTNQGFKSIVPYVADCSRFVALAMQTFAPEIDANAPGTTFKEVSGKIVAGVPFPLPPPAEQLRIVAKVEELMGLLDRLEAARTAREATRDRLTAASLNRLTAPDTTPEVFPAHACFALDALPALTSRSDQIKSLRQTILNLAVRGKLEEQDPNDEWASELLKRIRRERDGQKSKRERGSAGAAAASRFELDLPSSWAVASLGEISLQLHYGYTASASNTDKEVRLLRITDIQENCVEWDNVPGCEIDAKTFPKYALEPGDLLIARTGGTIGKTFLVSGVPVKSVFASYLIRVQPARALHAPYVKLFCGSDIYWDQLREGSRGGGQPNVNGKTLGMMNVPLPPLAEQHRIVVKVDALMAICDRLEAALTAADTTKQRLLEALLREVFTLTTKAVTEATG